MAYTPLLASTEGFEGLVYRFMGILVFFETEVCGYNPPPPEIVPVFAAMCGSY